MTEKNITFFDIDNIERPMLIISMEHIPRIDESVVITENEFHGEYTVVHVKTNINKCTANVSYNVYLRKKENQKILLSFLSAFPHMQAAQHTATALSRNN